MSNFKVGQKVVCIAKVFDHLWFAFNNHFYDLGPNHKEICTIKSIDIDGNLFFNEYDCIEAFDQKFFIAIISNKCAIKELCSSFVEVEEKSDITIEQEELV